MKFKTTVILGRFQPIHIGHQKLINLALAISEKVLILVGSSDKKETLRNPFDADYRVSLIKKIYKEEIEEGRIVISKLPDLTDESDLSFKWGEYVINNAKDVLKENVECIIYGKEQNISKCFSKELLENITEISIPRSKMDISATKLREYILNFDVENFKKYTSFKIHDEYEYLQKVLINIEKKKEEK